MTEVLEHKSAGNVNSSTLTVVAVLPFSGWRWVSVFLRGRADFGCPLSYRDFWPCAVPSAEPGQGHWDYRDNWIREVTMSVIIFIIIIIIPVPHFPSLLKLLVCTQKQGLFSKGTSDAQGDGCVCLGSPPRAAAVWGRKDRHLCTRGPCPDPKSCPSRTRFPPRRHSGLSSWKLPGVTHSSTAGRVSNTWHVFQQQT